MLPKSYLHDIIPQASPCRKYSVNIVRFNSAGNLSGGLCLSIFGAPLILTSKIHLGLIQRSRNTAFCQKNGNHSKRTTQNVTFLAFWGPLNLGWSLQKPYTLNCFDSELSNRCDECSVAKLSRIFSLFILLDFGVLFFTTSSFSVIPERPFTGIFHLLLKFMQKDLCTSQSCLPKNYCFYTCNKTEHPRTSGVQWKNMSIVYSATYGSTVIIHSIGHQHLQTLSCYFLFVGHSKRFDVIAIC